MPSFFTHIKAERDTESLKGWCMLNNLTFAVHVANVIRALSEQRLLGPGCLPNENAYIKPTNMQATRVSGSTSSVREAVARHIHKHRIASL